MNRFLSKILKFIILIFVVFFCIQFCLDSILKNESNCNNTWSKVFKGDIETDIAIIGNSRAEVHYNPEVINDITGLSCYNLGLSGTPINIFEIRWNAFINRNKLPSILIIDVDYNFLGAADGVFEKYNYLPYVNEIEYQNVVKSLDDDLLLDQYLPLYKYIGQSQIVVSKIKSFFNANCDNFINGFKVNKAHWDENHWSIFKNKKLNEVAEPNTFNTLYNEGFTRLSSTIDFCKRNNIEVLLVWSPQFVEVQSFKTNQRTYVDSLLTNFANVNKLDYLNFSNDSLVYRKVNFYNHSHLNYNGSAKFSKTIANYINAKRVLL